MKIALIGGHGKVSLLTIPLLVNAGHSVSAVIRNPDHAADVESRGATSVVADIETMDHRGFVDVLAGHDAVIWSAGAGGGNPARTRAVDRDAAIASIDAAQEVGARRYVMVSYFGAGRPGRPHGVGSDSAFYPYAEAKAAADAHLRASRLDWTIVGPSALTLDSPTESIDVNTGMLAPGRVARGDVAAVIAASVSREDLAGATIEFNGGATPIPAALDVVARANRA